MSSGGQMLGPGPGPLDLHGHSIINESMWDAVFPLLDAHFLQVERPGVDPATFET
jgi:hypothetical protein